ncbi:TetR/AcrR family transcriptional regulator [Sphingomonas sp. DT-51]|uniref:TetR/AcrR family transcriptional regulator n=1 Tax=Sphingomonas sp. DT-51 TaxID=3396165 RepID=UPI003F1C250E
MARPRGFDEQVVIDRAKRLFWDRGYEGTSLSELLAHTGLTKSSLYKAFGSKEDLFRKVVASYDDRQLDFRRRALAETTPRSIVASLLRGMAALHAGDDTPRGCLVTNAALACSPESDGVRLKLVEEREAFRRALGVRLAEVSGGSDLPSGASADEAASLVQTMIQGMAVQARSGASHDELARVAEVFLRSWPEPNAAFMPDSSLHYTKV